MALLPLTKTAAINLLQSQGQILDNYSKSEEYSLDAIKNKLRALIAQTTKIALSAYARLGYTGNDIQEVENRFNQRLQQAKSGVSALSGLSLEQCFLQALKEASAFSLNMQQEYNEFVNFLERRAEKNGSDVASEFAKEMKGLIGDFRVTMSSDGSTARFASGSGKLSGAFAPKFSPTFTELSSKMRKDVGDYISKNKGSFQLESETFSSDENSISMQWMVDSVDINSFLKMKAEEKTILFRRYPEILDILNQKFIGQIIQKCGTANQAYLRRAIQKVIGKEGGKEAFFVGGNIKDMTGILGEIQVLYYLLEITDGKIDENMGWVGGLNNPHSDIILRQLGNNFGIQVKNTSTDIEKQVEFQGFNFEGAGASYMGQGFMKLVHTDAALEELKKIADTQLVLAIENILGMESFNVEYRWHDGAAHEEGNEEFVMVRSEILTRAKQALQIAQIFPVAMMYMQTEMQSNQQSNILYFVAGEKVRSAATILLNILRQLDEEISSFKLTMKNRMTVNEKQKNIVDFLNAKEGEHNFHYTLQSSYNF